MPFTPSGLWTPQRTTHVASNLVRAYEGASPHSRNLGQQFYPNWNRDAQYIGERSGHGVEHGASMIARLSPTTEAEMNRMMGLQLLSVDDRSAALIHRSAAVAAEAARHPTGSVDRERLRGEAMSLRERAGLAGTPLNLQSSVNIGHALRIRDGEVADPLGSLGRVKIGDFGHTIADPYRRRQVVDTHYHDAALNRTDIPYDADRGLSAISRYTNIQAAADSAYQRAGRIGLVDHREVPANGFMGGIWYAHQQRKVAENSDARTARRASESRIANFLSNSPSAASGRSWNPAHHGLVPSLNHIVY